MKKNKTALITAIAVITISLLLYFLPMNSIIGQLPFVKTFYNNTSLEILTQRSKAIVTIDGKDYGETPTNIENLAEGKYTVVLTRVAEEGTFYEPVTINIEMARNTSARIDMEIGPSDITHGTILYYTSIPKTSENEGLLTVTSSANEAKVYIDGEYLKKTPVSGLTLRDNQYQIKVTAQGYEPIEIPIFIRKGYHLNLKTYHFPIPVNLGTAN
jgi:diacylglycerol kinase family enzyme